MYCRSRLQGHAAHAGRQDRQTPHHYRHREGCAALRERGTPPLCPLREPSRSSVQARKLLVSQYGGRLMRHRTIPRRRENLKPQLSYFTKSDGKLARVRATARALSSASKRDCSCARWERAASLRNALMRSCLIWTSLQGERARRNRVFASRRRASRGSSERPELLPQEVPSTPRQRAVRSEQERPL